MYDRFHIKKSFLKIKKSILPKFVKEPYPSNLVNGTKKEYQNMVNGTTFVPHNWLGFFVPLTDLEGQFLFH